MIVVAVKQHSGLHRRLLSDQFVVCCVFTAPFGIASFPLEVETSIEVIPKNVPGTSCAIHKFCPMENQKKVSRVELSQYHVVEGKLLVHMKESPSGSLKVTAHITTPPVPAYKESNNLVECIEEIENTISQV